jgi:hypothetical protein
LGKFYKSPPPSRRRADHGGPLIEASPRRLARIVNIPVDMLELRDVAAQEG